MNESALKVIAELYPKHGVELWRHVQFEYEGLWHDCREARDFNPSDTYEYRVKPNTHIVNGIECPAPLRELPGYRDEYYVLNAYSDDGISIQVNSHDGTTLNYMRFGIWLTYEDAKANRDAYYPGFEER